MNIKVAKDDRKVTIRLSGGIDIPGAERLKKALLKILDGDAVEACIDFEDVTFIGSAGIGKLLLFYKKFIPKGGTIKVVNLNNEIAALFKSIKMDKLFNS